MPKTPRPPKAPKGTVRPSKPGAATPASQAPPSGSTVLARVTPPDVIVRPQGIADAAPVPPPRASALQLALAGAREAALPSDAQELHERVGALDLPDTGSKHGRALTEDQRIIVTDTRRHLQIDAGAGSGKTSTIIEKILFELGYGNVPGCEPETRLRIDQIAAITFTRKAAGEITDRLRREFLVRAHAAEGADREWWAEQMFRIDAAKIGTLDSFAYGLLREYGPLVGLETGFRLLEQGEGEALYDEVAESLLLGALDRRGADDLVTPGARFLVTQFGFLRSRALVSSLLGKQLAQLRVIGHRVATGALTWERAAAQVGLELSAVDRILEPHALAVLRFLNIAAQRLMSRFTQDGLVDHQLVLLKAATLAKEPEVQRAFRGAVRLLFVDEHQDSNEAQLAMVSRLAGLDQPPVALAPGEEPPVPGTRINLIGDPKQGIYGFRGADITMWRKSLLLVTRHHGREVHLRDNHRSRPALGRFFDHALSEVMAPVDPLAGTAFQVDYQPLVSRRPETPGAPVEVLLADSAGPEASAELVAARVAAMLAHPDRFPVYERGPDGQEHARPVRARDIVVLARALRDSADAYERALQAHGIGCFVYGGRGLFAREEIQDLTILLRAVADPTDAFALLAFLRSPLAGLDDLTLAELCAHANLGGSGATAPLYDTLRQAEAIVPESGRRDHAMRASELLASLIALRDRLPHHELLERAVVATRYRAYLAGAPDAPAGVRNIEKLLKIARDAGRLPLYEFVQQLGARVRRADREDEAPIYSPDDDLVVISTIHKAKGLEWPYVILTGLDEKVVRQPFETEPRLDGTFGLALPLDVVVRDDEADVPSPDNSRVWRWHSEQQMLRDYAEAKRLFYVACTRARDGLVLAAALSPDRRGKDIRRPQSLMGNDAGWLHLDRYDRWLRWVFPALIVKRGTEATPQQLSAFGAGEPLLISRGLDAIADGIAGADPAIIAPAPPQGATPVAVGVVSASAAVLPSALSLPAAAPAPTPAAASAPGSASNWPWVPLDALSQPTPDAAWPEEVVRRLAPITTATIRDSFTASELLAFHTCGWKHFYGFRHGVSQAVIERAATAALITDIPPSRRGAILHEYLRRFRDQWTEADAQRGMVEVLQRQVAIPEAQAQLAAGPFLTTARRFLTSDLYRRVQAAMAAGRPVLREVPFVHQLTPRYRSEGVIDLAFLEEDGWVLVDFKDALFEGIEDKAAAKDAAAAKYMIQAALYTDAFGVAAGTGVPVKEFVFFFTSVDFPGGLTVQQPAVPAWLDMWRERIKHTIHRILHGDYGETPQYSPGLCDSCNFRFMCRPEGAPAEVTQLARRTPPAVAAVAPHPAAPDAEFAAAVPARVSVQLAGASREPVPQACGESTPAGTALPVAAPLDPALFEPDEAPI